MVKPRIPKNIIEDISLEREPATLKRVVKISYDGNQFSFKIPIKIATELSLKKDDKFEILIENTGEMKLRRI